MGLLIGSPTNIIITEQIGMDFFSYTAIISQIISELAIEDPLVELVLLQSIFAGVNIGTYVTQIGALAGILWFSQMRTERGKQSELFPELAQEMKFLNRKDLITYGFLHFIWASTLLIIFFITQLAIIRL